MTIVAQPPGGVVELLDALHDLWCVYAIHVLNDDGSEPVIFIGACEIHAVYRLNEAYRNTRFQDTVTGSTSLRIRISHTGDRNEMLRTRSNQIATLRPDCNMNGFDSFYFAREIECIETGQKFASQTEAAKALGINQAQLSQHIQRRPGFKTVKGLTFRKVDKVSR